MGHHEYTAHKDTTPFHDRTDDMTQHLKTHETALCGREKDTSDGHDGMFLEAGPRLATAGKNCIGGPSCASLKQTETEVTKVEGMALAMKAG